MPDILGKIADGHIYGIHRFVAKDRELSLVQQDDNQNDSGTGLLLFNCLL